jgi:hypothetical protein
MSQALIRSTFLLALDAYAKAHYPVLPIAREGAAFTKPVNFGTFLEAFIIPADTTMPNVDGSRRRFRGDFQVNIWVKDAAGAQVGELIAEELYKLFPVLPKSTYYPVSIEGPASINRAVLDASGYRVIPVLIPYRMESSD